MEDECAPPIGSTWPSENVENWHKPCTFSRLVGLCVGAEGGDLPEHTALTAKAGFSVGITGTAHAVTILEQMENLGYSAADAIFLRGGISNNQRCCFSIVVPT